jgi:hypothetical protein
MAPSTVGPHRFEMVVHGVYVIASVQLADDALHVRSRAAHRPVVGALELPELRIVMHRELLVGREGAFV